MKSKNILEVCFSPDLGGLELYMSRCAQELSKEFNTFCAISQISKLKSYLASLETFELRRKSSFSLFTSLKLAKIIDTRNIDIVHIHWTKDIPIVVLAKLFSKKKPKIIQTRHMTMTRFKDDFYHKFLYKNIDTIICVTKALEEQINKFIPQNIRPQTKTLYLGSKDVPLLDDNEKEMFKKEINLENSFMISLIGRINQFKGQYLLIEAMKVLIDKGYDIQSYIIGHAMKNEYLEELKQKVLEYKLESNIHFIGFSKEPYKFMQISDVVLMTSKNETFGLVTIEAMKNSTAVIASNSGGVLEIVQDGKNGLLFESENYDDLALKIEQLYNNELLKNSLAVSGKKTVDEFFDSEKQFRKLIHLFHTF